MSFSDHKITQFTHKITDLPDQPSLPANELKARFDSSPEELRQAVNGICDDASRLEARVEGIVVDTFGDTIDREMLSDELAAELDAKAKQTALTSEAQTRETADSALDTRLATAESALTAKCEVYFGTYTPSSEQQTDQIVLGFQPKGLLMFPQQITRDWSWLWMIWPGAQSDPTGPYQRIRFTANGFAVDWWSDRSSTGMAPYRYLAFK